MADQDLSRAHEANQEARAVWNENAAFWDARMGEGNDFVEVLVWPDTAVLGGKLSRDSTRAGCAAASA